MRKSIEDTAREIVALRAENAKLKQGKNAAKLARSAARHKAYVDAGESEVECRIAAASVIAGTCKGALVRYMFTRGAGEYTCAILRKGIQKEFAATAANVDTALAMLVKGLKLRKLAGYTLDYLPLEEKAILVERVSAKPKAAKKAKAVRKISEKPKEGEIAA